MERQLREFYSPLLGLRSDILARSELRVRVQEAADFTWKQLCEEARETGVEALGAVSRERGPEFKRIVEYENARLERELLPAYRQMVGMFRENLWLAEPETRRYYGSLVEFIDLWDRWMAKSVPAEVLERLGHSEEGLHPFYEHLQRKHDELQASVRSGTA